MKHRRGALIWPTNFDSYWINMASRAGLNVLGLHPIPESDPAHPNAAETMLRHLNSTRFKQARHDLQAAGIDLEFELHAMRLLLPRKLFDSNPEWFRLDETGVRNPDRNYCTSREEPSRIVEHKAA